jgi:hypothetical protein
VTALIPESVEPRPQLILAVAAHEQRVEIEQLDSDSKCHDEVDGRTRLEIRQRLPEHVTGPSEGGWLEAFAKLDAMLNCPRAGVGTGCRGVAVWPS